MVAQGRSVSCQAAQRTLRPVLLLALLLRSAALALRRLQSPSCCERLVCQRAVYLCDALASVHVPELASARQLQKFAGSTEAIQLVQVLHRL